MTTKLVDDELKQRWIDQGAQITAEVEATGGKFS